MNQSANFEPAEELRLILQNDLCQRIKRNPRYSLRAFAKTLDVSHTVLSLVLSRKRHVSKKAALKIAKSTTLSNSDCEKFVNWSLGKKNNSKPVDSTKEYHRISLDIYEAIADWHHYAILSLLDIPKTNLQPRWISKKLGISIIEAKGAIERLKRLGLIELRNNKWKQSTPSIIVENTHSTTATLAFHRDLLLKAIQSLEQDPMPTRDFSSTTFAMDPNSVEYGLKKIRSFRRALTKDLETRGRPSEVYTIAVQLFPLTKISKETKK